MHTPFTIGVAGHVDHGKTTLVRALTGVDTDRKAEEKARGLSIESGVAELQLPDGRRVALIDVPGHTDFLKNTIRGLNSVDLALLVVAADDGVMPQTREHLEILKFFKATGGLVVLSKTDLVDAETVDLAQLELDELLGGTFLAQHPIFPFSERRPELGVDIIRGIAGALPPSPARPPKAAFRLWIDQAKSIAGHGTVVSGTVNAGTIRVNDEIELLPVGVRTRVRSLECHARSVDQAVAGQRVGINLHRVSVADVGRGMCLAAAGTIPPVTMLNVDLQVLAAAPRDIKNRQKVKCYLGTSVTNAMLVLMDGDCLAPGAAGLGQLRLAAPVAALPQDAFVIAPLNRNLVLAGGRVLETTREKYRAAKSHWVMPLLRALQNADAAAYLAQVLHDACGSLTTARELAGRTGLPRTEFERLINAQVQKGELTYFKGRGAVKTSHLAALTRQFLAIVADLFRQDPLRKPVTLRAVAERLEYPVVEVLLANAAEALVLAGDLAQLDGGWVPAPSRAVLDARREGLGRRLLDFARSSGLTPFSADTFWKQHAPEFDKDEIRRMLNYLFARKKIVRLGDQRFLSLDALETIKQRVAAAVDAKGFVAIGDCKALLGYGRWGGTHVLDYLNAIGFTVRRDDKHYLKDDRN